MKYLDGYPELDLLARALSFTSASIRVSTRIEAYSCKAITREKRLFKALEQDMKTDLEISTSTSPPDQHSAVLQSAFGPLDNPSNRKTLWDLIATLNLAFPDHDFSRVNAEEFVKEGNPNSVLTTLSNALNQLKASPTSAHSTLSPAGMRQVVSASSLPTVSGRQYASYPPSLAMTLPGYNPLHQHRYLSTRNTNATAFASNTRKRKSVGSSRTSNAGSPMRSRATKGGERSSNRGNNKENTVAKVVKHKSSSGTIAKPTQVKPRKSRKSGENSSSSTSKGKKGAIVQANQRKDDEEMVEDDPSITFANRLADDLNSGSDLQNGSGSGSIPGHPLLRQVLEPIIELDDCEVYSYTPELDSDPHAYQSDDEEEYEEDYTSNDEQLYSAGEDDRYAHVATRMGGKYSDEEFGWEMDGIEGSHGMHNYADSDSSGDGRVSNTVPPTPTSFKDPSTRPSKKKTKRQQTFGGGRGLFGASSGGEGHLSPGSYRSQSFSNAGMDLDDLIFDSPNRSHFNSAGNPLSTILMEDPSSVTAPDFGDEETGGLLWSSNYFFYNKKMKRLLFISCWGRKIGAPSSSLSPIMAPINLRSSPSLMSPPGMHFLHHNHQQSQQSRGQMYGSLPAIHQRDSMLSSLPPNNKTNSSAQPGLSKLGESLLFPPSSTQSTNQASVDSADVPTPSVLTVPATQVQPSLIFGTFGNRPSSKTGNDGEKSTGKPEVERERTAPGGTRRSSPARSTYGVGSELPPLIRETARKVE